MSQEGAFVLKRCVNCGEAFPVRNNPSSIRQTLYCPDCKSSRHAEIERESKHRRVMQRRNAEKARRLREFLAARDAAFERAGLPVPKIEVRDGKIIETRGTVTVASWAKGRYHERYN